MAVRWCGHDIPCFWSQAGCSTGEVLMDREETRPVGQAPPLWRQLPIRPKGSRKRAVKGSHCTKPPGQKLQRPEAA